MSRTAVTIEEIVARTPDLPTIPAAAIKVMRETEKSDASATSVAKILTTDQSLSARVLRLANSSFYGMSRKVENLSEAVVILGMRSVKNLAVVASTYPYMSRAVTGYALEPGAMWEHACGTAVGAQLVAQLSGKVPGDVAFTCGLLHDVGKLALSINLENKIGAILLYAQREELAFDEAERRILGYDHCQVGAYLTNSWNMPESVVMSARFHHDPESLPEPKLVVDAVHVGEFLATSMGFGLGGDGLLYKFQSSSLDRLGIKEEELDRITDSFIDQFEEFESLFSELKAA
ncbi:MAG: HDOD domain-containing protein [Armatimonadetes bacterium]|nr:HDOD domain-containing protein [Armatimonadota bacterium]